MLLAWIILILLVIFAVVFKNKIKLNLIRYAIVFFIIAYVSFSIYKFLSRILVIDDFEGKISAQTVDYGAGAGSQIEVSGSKDIKYHGNQALKLKYKSVAGGYMWVARGYGLDVKGAASWREKPAGIKWSKYSSLGFYMYGQNSGAIIAVDIIDSDFEYFRFIVKDDFTGWKEIVCPFDKFLARGDWQPVKAKTNAVIDFPVRAFQFEPRPIAEGVVYFDYVHLIRKD
ncbi:MAG: carbohydrate binding domain-containing protein [Candidatus Omnitrophica bacterium]|nr:carbohydrate binding domain-containing protein [Candidatus Omnitrophota bacterium]MDD5351974.1 carbohydrate binding domain-containing protein [Candidatus Omnitrophota bacterium]MDD5550800.1 carbohydrate binding domain-containing protein [Candidatus Omnitrophota bacterium]